MTTPTHTAFSFALGCGAMTLHPQLFPNCSTLEVCLMFILLGNLPDIDILFQILPKATLNTFPQLKHRGITHSFWIPIVSGVLASLVFHEAPLTGEGLSLTLTFTLTVALHLFMDTIDHSNGVSLFAPFSKKKYCFSWQACPSIVPDSAKSLRSLEWWDRACMGVASEIRLTTLPIAAITILWYALLANGMGQ